MRFLIAQTSFLGDVVLSTPVCAAVRRHYAGAHITMLVRPENAAVLEGHPHVDAVLTDDKRRSERGRASLRVLRKLRQGDFDVALALHKSFRTAWLLAAAGIPQRVGFRESAGWFLYPRRAARDRARHDVERNLSILAGLDLDPEADRARPFVACSSEAVARFHAALRQHGISPEASFVGIAPGSAWATKRWTVDGYAAVLTYVHGALRAVPVLLGARGDMAYAAAIQHAAGGLGVNLVGQTDVALLVAAIDACGVLVTNDSAPMHIAVARDTPVVAIFGPTTLQQGFGPYTDRAVVVQHDLSCRPCGRHGARSCPIGTHACMRDIAAAEVTAAVDALLRRPRRRSAVATV
jgi:heptosyltransferase-2